MRPALVDGAAGAVINVRGWPFAVGAAPLPRAGSPRSSLRESLARARRGVTADDRRCAMQVHSPFSDVAGSAFVSDIESLAAAGITRGCDPPVNDRFCPGDPVTRAQMASLLVRALPG